MLHSISKIFILTLSREFFKNKHRLREVILRDNAMTHVIWDQGYESIEKIDLSENQIEVLDFSSPFLTNGSTYFNLDENNSTSLRIHADNLQANVNFTISLANNQFHCDLSLSSLLKTKETIPQINVLFENAACSQPKSMRGRLMKDVYKKDLKCAYDFFFLDCSCVQETTDKHVLLVNCSHIGPRPTPDLNAIEIKIPHDIKVENLQFNFENISLKTLPVLPLTFKYEVSAIFAANNKILELLPGNINESIKTLDLRNNELKELSADVIQKILKIDNVYLSGNPWTCDCSHIEFFNMMKTLERHVMDYEHLACSGYSKSLAELRAFEVCFNWPLVAGCSVGFAMLAVIVALFYKFNKIIKIFLYAHNMCLWFVTEEELDEDKVYDAFVCFAAPDQPLVEDIILGLEAEPYHFNCLVGVRDWPPGEQFAELVS